MVLGKEKEKQFFGMLLFLVMYFYCSWYYVLQEIFIHVYFSTLSRPLPHLSIGPTPLGCYLK